MSLDLTISLSSLQPFSIILQSCLLKSRAISIDFRLLFGKSSVRNFPTAPYRGSYDALPPLPLGVLVYERERYSVIHQVRVAI